MYRASILINSEQAENKIDTLKKQIAEVKARADKAFAEGKVDVWKAANKEAESLKKKLDKQERLALVYREYKHHFLWWKWGTKGYRLKIVNFNPHARVTYNRYILSK